MTHRPAASENTPESIDSFLGGRIVLVQPRGGHRAGLEAALLQALVPAAAAGTAVDLGAGTGVVAFSCAARAPALRVVGIEQDAELVACAEEALRLPQNTGFADRVRMIVGDAAAPGIADRSADWVLMNPPFDRPGAVRLSPDPRRGRAHVGPKDLLAAWVEAAARLLKAGGSLGLVHRAEALPAILSALGGGFGGVCILPVHPFERQPARRVLVAARREGRAPLQLLPGLVLHTPERQWTDAAAAVLRGGAELSLQNRR